MVWATVAVFTLQLVLDIPLSLLIDGVLAQRFTGFYPAHAPGGDILNTWLGYQSDLFVGGHLWKPFTYMFLHGSLSHLFWNMLLLFFFGPGLERAIGSRQFLRFYIMCGAVAVLANLFPDFLSPGPSYLSASVTGGSGAVMGVVVAFVLLDLDREYFLFPFPVPVTGRALLLILVAINVLYAFMQTNVSVATHFGGMAFGYAYMKLLPRYARWRRKHPFRRRAAPKPARKSGPVPSDEDKELGSIIDNILKFKDKEWK